jgi:hypothetical protein
MPKLSILWKTCGPRNNKQFANQQVFWVNWEPQSHIKNWPNNPGKQKPKCIHKPYSIEAPSTEDNHTVKSAPQARFFTSDTRQRTGDDSISTNNEATM